MCKIFVVPSVSPKKEVQKRLWQFVGAIQPQMSRTDNDGFGLMAVTESGLYTEKWVDVKDVFVKRSEGNAVDRARASQYLGFIEAQQTYAQTGQYGKTVKSIALHARAATCGISIENTHPFRDGDTALIHNGIVSRVGLKFKTSTCDSEGILNEYTGNNVPVNPANIDEALENIDGYYACAVFTRDKANRWVLDVFKDSKASLVACFIAELDTMIFCTNVEIVKAACKSLKWKKPREFSIQDDSFIRFDVETGEAVHFQKINEYVDYDRIDMQDIRARLTKLSNDDGPTPVDTKLADKTLTDENDPFYVNGEGYDYAG